MLQVSLTALPSKRLGLFAADGTLIVRSDSNGEDLEAFAGAGATCVRVRVRVRVRVQAVLLGVA